DGLLQAETGFLLGVLRDRLGGGVGVVLTVRESLAAVAGVEVLRRHGLHVDAVSGLITNSPLLCQEAELGTGVGCVATAELGRRFANGDFLVAPGPTAGADAARAPVPGS